MTEKKEEKEDRPGEEDHAEEGQHGSMDIEPLLQAMGHGGYGPYQCIQVTLQLFCLFPVAFSVMSHVFIGFKPPYHCASVNDSRLEVLIGWSGNSTANMAVDYAECSIQVQTNDSGQIEVFTLPCVEGYEYEADKDSTIFTEWDLTCEKSALTEVSQMLMIIGQAAGAFSLTSVADRFGRKPVYVTCSIGMLVVAGAMALSPNFIVFIVCRILIGVLQQGTSLVPYVMFIENLPKNYRRMAGVVDGGVWSMAIMSLPALAYLLRDHSWRYLQVALAGFSLYSLILPWCLDESLRWLVANKKKARAEYVLKRACRINRIPYHKARQVLDAIFVGRGQPLIAAETDTSALANAENTERLLLGDATTNETNGKLDKLLLDENGHGDLSHGKEGLDAPITYEINAALTESGEVKKYTALDIFRNNFMMKITFAITYVWVVNGLTYYGLMLTSATVTGNRFLNFFLQALMEFPAYVTVFFCLKRFGRRSVIIGFLGLTSVSLLLSSILLATVTNPVVGPITNVLSLMGKFGISGSFSTLFIFCPELFPTNLRNAGLGISSSFSRIGGMVAPFSYNLAAVALWAPSALFGCMALLGTYIMRELPETRGRPMATTIDELKLMYGGKKKSREEGRTPTTPTPTHPPPNSSSVVV